MKHQPKRARSRGKHARITAGSLTAALAITLLLPIGAAAGGMDTFGFTSRSIGMGGAVTAEALDISALYYNPGLLAEAPNGVAGGFLVTFHKLHIELRDRPAAADVTDAVYDYWSPTERYPPGGSPTLPTDELRNPREDTTVDAIWGAVYFGAAHDLGIDWLKIGGAVYVPLVSSLNAGPHFPDEREALFSNRLHFTNLGQPQTSPSLLVGLAVRPVCWFKAGIALDLHRQLIHRYRVYLPNPAYGDLQVQPLVESDSELTYAASFNAGMAFDITEWWTAGLAYRFRSFTPEDSQGTVKIWDAAEQADSPYTEYGYTFTHDYRPHELALGFRWGRRCPWMITTDVIWRMWSFYEPVYPNTSTGGLHDTVTARVGTELQILDELALRLGLGYVMNPVPEQPGRTNYVDNDRIDIGLGLGLDLPWPEDARLDIHGQLLALIPRTYYKGQADNPTPDEDPLTAGWQTNNPGYPGYRSSGLAASAGMTLNVPFD